MRGQDRFLGAVVFRQQGVLLVRQKILGSEMLQIFAGEQVDRIMAMHPPQIGLMHIVTDQL